MRFLLDESADLPLGAYLSGLGHDVAMVARDYSQALKDREVLAIAWRESRILITNDRHFGELVFRQRLQHAGVILFRLGDETLRVKVAWLRLVITDYTDWLEHFVVVTDRGVRIRRTAGN